MKNFLLILLSATLFACESADNATPATEEEIRQEKMLSDFDLVNLTAQGMPIEIYVPHNRKKTEVHFNSDFGRMEINCGDSFNYYIIEDNPDMDLKKNEIESSIFTIKYIVDEPNLIIYESSLPDGSSKYYHFFAIQNVADKFYLVEDNPLREFLLTDIEKMAESATKFQPAIAT